MVGFHWYSFQVLLGALQSPLQFAFDEIGCQPRMCSILPCAVSASLFVVTCNCPGTPKCTLFQTNFVGRTNMPNPEVAVGLQTFFLTHECHRLTPQSQAALDQAGS